jgi:hypothetical protein
MLPKPCIVPQTDASAIIFSCLSPQNTKGNGCLLAILKRLIFAKEILPLKFNKNVLA